MQVQVVALVECVCKEADDEESGLLPLKAFACAFLVLDVLRGRSALT